MRDLTLSQEYLICAVNEKGTLFTFNTEKLVCLVAAALLELQLEGCAAVDKKFITVTGPLPQEMAHLRPLYDYLNTGKPMQTESSWRSTPTPLPTPTSTSSWPPSGTPWSSRG